MWENYTIRCFCKALHEITDVKYLAQCLSYNKYYIDIISLFSSSVCLQRQVLDFCRTVGRPHSEELKSLLAFSLFMLPLLFTQSRSFHERSFSSDAVKQCWGGAMLLLCTHNVHHFIPVFKLVRKEVHLTPQPALGTLLKTLI